MLYVASDLHVDAVLRRSEISLHHDGYHSFANLAATVVRDINEHGHKDNHLILAGDITEMPRISGSTIESLKTNIEILKKNKVNVHFIRGNHDIDRGIGIAKALGANHLDGEELFMLSDDGTWTVRGFDYAPTEEIRSKVQKCAACDLLVLHSPFEHLLKFEGAWQLTLSDIPDNIRITVSGDIHKHEIRPFVRSAVDETERWFVSPGSTHACDLSELGPYGVVRLSKTEAPVFLPIYARKIQFFTLKSDDSFDFIREQMQMLVDLQEPLMSIVVFSFLPEQWQLVQNIRSVFDGKLIFIEKQIALTASAEPAGDIKIDLEHPEAALPFLVNPETDGVLFDFLSELLTNPNSTVILKKLEEIGIK
jgi:DNA repair exonuclease SbcCD nuclease subunit